MVSIENAILQSINLSNSKKQDKSFTTYSPIYISPTVNVKNMCELYSNKKTVLSVGLPHTMYELMLKGVINIDCFDKNILQYFYYELINAAVKVCNFEEFITVFTTTSQGNEEYFYYDENIFNKIFDKMDDLPKNYWKTLFYVKRNLFNTNFCRKTTNKLEYLVKNSSLYKKEKYKKIQNILLEDRVKVNYTICDLESIKNLYNKKYDLIMLDNILQYYKNIESLKTIKKVHKFIKKSLKPMLYQNGHIQVDYGFEMQYLALNDKKIDKNIINKSKIKEEKKNGVISNLMNKKSYKIDYIRSVENNPKIKNIVLTYKKS